MRLRPHLRMALNTILTCHKWVQEGIPKSSHFLSPKLTPLPKSVLTPARLISLFSLSFITLAWEPRFPGYHPSSALQSPLGEMQISQFFPPPLLQLLKLSHYFLWNSPFIIIKTPYLNISECLLHFLALMKSWLSSQDSFSLSGISSLGFSFLPTIFIVLDLAILLVRIPTSTLFSIWSPC